MQSPLYFADVFLHQRLLFLHKNSLKTNNSIDIRLIEKIPIHQDRDWPNRLKNILIDHNHRLNSLSAQRKACRFRELFRPP